MKTILYSELNDAIIGITNKLGINLDQALQRDYQNGKYPQLLSYEKVENSTLEIPAIQKYLIGAQAILNQPCQFYDIYRSSRHFLFVQILHYALNTIIEKVNNYENRFSRLIQEKLYDPFDAVLFELVVAAQYASIPGISDVAFLEGKDRKLPDFEFHLEKDNFYVECKKFDRSVNIVSHLRDAVREKAKLTLDAFVKMYQSAVLEVSFHEDPRLIPDTLIRDVCIEAFKSQTIIKSKSLDAIARPLRNEKLREYTLYPSPMYYWLKYGYRETGEWFGIINVMNAKYARHVDCPPDKELASTWLADVDFDCALKWKITDEKVIWSYKRLGYGLLFKGLSQLKAQGPNSILHAWYERDGSLGNRKNELLDFYNRISTAQKDRFSWIIFNETVLDVSVEGRFDLIEHAHVITGPNAKMRDSLATTVFTRGDEDQHEGGEFGIGTVLPDIDDIIKKEIP